MELSLRTPRLTLRPLQPDDAPDLNRIANQPHVLKRMPDWKSTPEETRRLIEAIAPRFSKATKESACVIFAILFGGVLIGIVGIGNKPEADNEIEIAFFISETYTGQGYAAEAAKAAARWAFDTLRLDYLIAIAELDNLPSRRVLEKCGFRKLETRHVLNAGETEEKPFDYYRLYRE